MSKKSLFVRVIYLIIALAFTIITFVTSWEWARVLTLLVLFLYFVSDLFLDYYFPHNRDTEDDKKIKKE